MGTLGVGLVPFLLVLSWSCWSSDAYRPVIIVHGIFDKPQNYGTIIRYIKQAHIGTEVTVVDRYNNAHGLTSLWKQVKGFRADIKPIMERSPDGVHLLCFSQGGMICRALLSVIPDHNVHTFIALSSPLAGQYGDTDYIRKLFAKHGKSLKENLFKFCYNIVGQLFSVCQYWNDPHHRDRYLTGNKFLPLLNGDTEHKNKNAWRENFLRIKKLVLIGGPDDGVITPWQSSLFSFYNINKTVVEMKDQEFYHSDVFGLKTLDSRGDISVCVQSGVRHVEWLWTQRVFTDCIQQWLI